MMRAMEEASQEKARQAERARQVEKSLKFPALNPQCAADRRETMAPAAEGLSPGCVPSWGRFVVLGTWENGQTDFGCAGSQPVRILDE